MSLVSMIMHSSIGCLLAGSKVNSRSSGPLHPAAATMQRCPPRRDCSAFDYRLQFHRHLNNGEKNVSLQARSSSEIVHIGLACPSFGGEYRFLSDIVSSCLTLDYIYKCPRKFTWPWMTLQFDEKPFNHVAQKVVRNPCYFEYREALR